VSHIVTIQTKIRDPAAIQAACGRLKLPPPTHGTFRLFSESATGHAVQLPGWRYPVVCDTEQGRVLFDNYGGNWGKRHELDKFMQMYSVEKARIEARKRGHSVTEQSLADGSIKLTIQVAGGAA
jgi:hypothetical protein